ncbi:hypothetical protein L0B53_01540 [Vibrio sp. SS-MA-C1-2]|uniref:hypothetical protein n=1 Tax=Vibrio sp. SS-MA-C1-2 TaxID=2908646 RepID=UPI001F2652A8|nr:hypothetical protein [Vibrio sp. SS-MA-C1-2]UJF17479.1 hypothetical protein L0B53_01540 [Vibrio sp. SS-MA-C1-2]
MKRLLSFIITLFISSSLIFSTGAIADGKLNSVIEAYRVTVDNSGEEVRSPAEEAFPGDIIEYQLVYSNVSEGDLKSLAITGPIPTNTTYVANSNRTKVDSEFTVSIDNKKTFESEPVKRKEVKDGKEVEVIISAEEYHALRWNTQALLKAGEEQVFTYRVKVN